MSRVTVDEVKEIIETSLENYEVVPFITVANLIVTDQLSSSSLSDAILKEIERWLSAHFISIRDPRITKVVFDDVEETYQGQTGYGLQSTTYGQQVMLLDSTGTFTNLGKKKVSFTSIDLGLD